MKSLGLSPSMESISSQTESNNQTQEIGVVTDGDSPVISTSPAHPSGLEIEELREDLRERADRIVELEGMIDELEGLY
jgi:hypothetical protein